MLCVWISQPQSTRHFLMKPTAHTVKSPLKVLSTSSLCALARAQPVLLLHLPSPHTGLCPHDMFSHSQRGPESWLMQGWVAAICAVHGQLWIPPVLQGGFTKQPVLATHLPLVLHPERQRLP